MRETAKKRYQPSLDDPFAFRMAPKSSHHFLAVFLFLLRCKSERSVRFSPSSIKEILFSHFRCVGSRSTSTDLCRLMEFEVKINDFPFAFNDVDQRLFYRTDHFCQKKPVLRSLFYPNLYQFQAPNNRWWTFYQSNETRETHVGSKQWCQAWNMKPMLSLPLGIFQQAWTKAKHLQRWKRVFVHSKNRTFSYKSVSRKFTSRSSLRFFLTSRSKPRCPSEMLFASSETVLFDTEVGFSLRFDQFDQRR